MLQAHVAAPQALAAGRALLVEDEDDTAAYLAERLAETGWAVERATDGIAGLALAAGGGFDVLVVDRMLPGADGLSVVSALRDRGVEARLLVCGDFLWDKPHDRAAFLDLASKLGVAAWLDFRGKIEDQSELLATLSASDVFLLPYSDGVSVRRGSFQAVSQLAIPLVTTAPDHADEFDLVPALREKIESPATALVPIDSSPDAYAGAILSVLKKKDWAIAVSLDDVWREAATRRRRPTWSTCGTWPARLR